MRSLNKGQGHSFCAFDWQFGMPHTKPRTKFEVFSSSSFGDMFDSMPKIVGVTWLRPRPLLGEIFLCVRSAFPIQSCIPNLKSLAQVLFEILRSKRIEVTSLTFQGHVTSSVTWPFDIAYAISYWWSFGTKSLSLTVSEIFSVNAWHDLDTTSKQRSRSFILVPIDFSYTTSYRLSIVTFALGRTV